MANTRKLFLILLISSLSFSALIAIFVFLFGDLGELEMRLLFTTLTIGGYSLTGLCSSVLKDKKKFTAVASIGIIISVLGFFITACAIWDFIPFSDVWKVILIFMILSFSIAHGSLILLIYPDKKVVNIAVAATIAFITTVASMLTYIILMEFVYIDEYFFRLLGVFAVLDVLGTIVTPILKRFR